MSVAYVDTSCLVAIAFGEKGSTTLARELMRFDELVSSGLLEAELKSAFKRERVDFDVSLVANLSWLLPDRPLTEEIERVLSTGYVRGADCWHLASALYLAPDPGSMSFITLDEPQRKMAKDLGFTV